MGVELARDARVAVSAGIAASLGIALCTSKAQAEEPPARVFTGIESRTDVFGRLNPIGGLLRTELAVQRGVRTGPLSPASRFFETGGAVGVNASFATLGVHLAWQPAPAFTLRFTERLTGHFGSVYTLYTFDSPNVLYGDAALASYSEPLRSGWQQDLEADATLRGLARPFFFSATTRASFVTFGPREPYALDFIRDLLVARSDVVGYELAQLHFVLWHEPEHGGYLGLGAFYEGTIAAESGAERHRLGPMAAYRSGWGELGQWRGFLALGINAVERNRPGEAMVQVGLGWDVRP